jgi:ribosomal protein L34E
MDIKCHSCGKTLGTVEEKSGVTVLRISNIMTVYRIHGYCECGAQVHWESGRIKMIVKRRGRDIINVIT